MNETPKAVVNATRFRVAWANCLPSEKAEAIRLLDEAQCKAESANCRTLLDALACLLDESRQPRPTL